MKKKSKSQTISKRKRAAKRKKQTSIKYKSKIENINYIINEYFKVFGLNGKQYNDILTDVEKILGLEKILGEKSDFYILQGSDTRQSRISKALGDVNDRKIRYRLTKLSNYLLSKPNAQQLARDTYGFNGEFPNKAIKTLSALDKLKSDAIPNYYAALDVVYKAGDSMKFKNKFSKLKGISKSSDEFSKIYEEIGKEITDYLEKMGKEGLNQIKRLQAESIYDELLPNNRLDTLRSLLKK